MIKLGCNVDRYRNADYSVHALKDMIYEVQIQCEDLLANQTQNDSYRLFNPPQFNQRVPNHKKANFFSADHSDTTMEISNLRGNSGERVETTLKSQLLEEKEKRLNL